MDDRQISKLEAPRLAVLAGLEEPLRKDKERAAAAYRDELKKTHKCSKCGNRESATLAGLKVAWTYATQAWGAAQRAGLEVVRRIDPEKRVQKKAGEAARVRAEELGRQLADAKRRQREAGALLDQAEKDSVPDRTLINERKAALAETAGSVKELGAELEALAARQTDVARLLEDAVTEWVAEHYPKGKALEQIEQELRAAILPKPTAKGAPKPGRTARASAATA